MNKNAKIELGKTPAEDGMGQPCKHIVKGTPLLDKASDNCFDKIANLVYKRSSNDKQPPDDEKQSD